MFGSIAFVQLEVIAGVSEAQNSGGLNSSNRVWGYIIYYKFNKEPPQTDQYR